MRNKMQTKLLLLILIMTEIVFGGEIQKNNDLSLTCTKKVIKDIIMKESRGGYLNKFSLIYDVINRQYCKVDTTTLRKNLVEIYLEYKPEKNDSDEIEDNYGGIWVALINCKEWYPDIEKMVAGNLEKIRLTDKYSYFIRLDILVNRSPNWYNYIYDMYKNEIDTVPSFDREWYIINTLVKRFGNSIDRSTKIKLESIFYSILQKDIGVLDIVDEYLIAVNPVYKDSKQRLQICKRTHEYFKNNPVVSKSPYYEYVSKVLEEFNKSKKTLTEYSPPFVVY